jgi:hypothetical protein
MITRSLEKEWDFKKNRGLKPSGVTPYSHKRVWWKCQKGHEWRATVDSRSLGNGCPYCSGYKASKDNNLTIRFPELVAEWDFERNGDLTPHNVLSGSRKRVWWVCKKGHKWGATINGRTNNNKTSGCPYCAGKKASQDNNLAVIFPDLVKEWDTKKNGILTPYNVTFGSKIKVWWKCERGHSWLASPCSRTGKGKTGCPLCGKQTSKVEFRLFCELSFVFPNAQWRKKIGNIECDVYLPNHNAAIEYDGVYWHRNKIDRDKRKEIRLKQQGIQLFRLREYGLTALSPLDIIMEKRTNLLDSTKNLLTVLSQHLSLAPNEELQYLTYLKSTDFVNEESYEKKAHTLSVPDFNSSVAAHPILSKEWDHYRNGSDKRPHLFTLGSNENIWWVCEKGHNWQSTIQSRSGRHAGCPECRLERYRNRKYGTKNNNLSLKFPDLALEWDFEKNIFLTPQDVIPGSHKKVWWLCSKEHSWQAVIKNRTLGRTGCPICYQEGRICQPKTDLENDLKP